MSEEEDDDDRNKVENCQDEENLCPNKTSVREGRGRKKGGQKLLSSEGNVTKGQDTGERKTAAWSAPKTCLFSLTVISYRGTGAGGKRVFSEYRQEEGQTEQDCQTEQ